MYRLSFATLVTTFLFAFPTMAQDSRVAKPSPGQNIMTWSQEQRTEWFRQLDQVVATAVVERGDHVHPLPTATGDFDVSYQLGGKSMDIGAYMASNDVTGLLILKDGKILAERYGLGRTADDRWTAWSVTKSVTSTLIGVAIKDGAIKSIDDQVTQYVPELKASAYDGVTIKNLITMSSGVKWDEDYESRTSDFFFMMDQPFLDQMNNVPRETEPGTKYNYNTGDTNILGLVLERAVNMPISQYLSEKIWAPYGMEKAATWWLNHGQEVAGANLSMTLRDFARFGKFFMNNGVIDGKSILPEGWVEEASTASLDTGWDKVSGYGYSWWVSSPNKFMALGIFGQTIYIEPKAKLVVVVNQSWVHADDGSSYSREMPFLEAVSAAFR